MSGEANVFGGANMVQHRQYLRFGFIIAVYYLACSILTSSLREGVKKNWEKAVRLTAWVDPPSPLKRSGKCEKF